jgi:hypothetical protein
MALRTGETNKGPGRITDADDRLVVSDDITRTLDNLRVIVTTAGTRVRLSGTALPVRRAIVTALLTNTGTIVPGGAAVVAAVGSRNGPALNAGDVIGLENVDLNSVYIDSTVNGEGVTVLYQS